LLFLRFTRSYHQFYHYSYWESLLFLVSFNLSYFWLSTVVFLHSFSSFPQVKYWKLNIGFNWSNPISGFMILMYIFESYLDLRQHKALKLPTLPKSLEGVISQEKFEKSRAYSLDKRLVLSHIWISFIGWWLHIAISRLLLGVFSQLQIFVRKYCLTWHDHFLHLTWPFLYFVQPLPFCSCVSDNRHRLYDFVLQSIALVLEGENLVQCLWSTNSYHPNLKLLFDVYWLQKSGDFVTLAGLNAENEIFHTLGFLAGLMIWSQVRFWQFLFLILVTKVTLGLLRSMLAGCLSFGVELGLC